MEKTSRNPGFQNKKLLILIVVCTVLAALFTFKACLDRPQDLGPKLEYIGMSYSSGCVLLFCDSPASTEYYFGTDMSMEELKGYFNNGKFNDIQKEVGAEDYAAFNLGFDPINTNISRGFNVRYYLHPESVLATHHLSTRKVHVISLSDWSYAQANASFK